MRGDETDFAKAFLRLFVDELIVGDKELRTHRPTATLASTASADCPPPPGGGNGAQFHSGLASPAGFEPTAPGLGIT